MVLRACCAVIACAAACDYAFRIDHIDLPDGAPSSDASPPCTNPVFFDDFAGPGVCKPWGSNYADLGATMTEAGKLVITPAPTPNSIGGCHTLVNWPFGSGVTAIVSDVLRGTSTYTVLEVHGIELQIMKDDMLRFQTSANLDFGAVPYASAMKWWRIRPMGASTIVGEYSVDGTTWVKIGQVAMTVPPMIGIEISAGTNTTMVNGTGTFEQLSICP